MLRFLTLGPWGSFVIELNLVGSLVGQKQTNFMCIINFTKRNEIFEVCRLTLKYYLYLHYEPRFTVNQ